MQKIITIAEAQKLSSPNPLALLTTRKPDGTTNIMALSWWTYLSNHPAAIGICLSNKGYSGTCIKANPFFSLSLPGIKLQNSAFQCGTCSGRQRDKVKELSIPLSQHPDFPVPYVTGSRIAFSCEMCSAYLVHDHTFYLCDVKQILGDDTILALFAQHGYAKLDIVSTEIPS